jgi:hypothetical protein
MAIRNDPDDYAWVMARNLRRMIASDERDDGSRPLLKDRLASAATVAAGCAGVMLMIGALVRAFG